ncbi:MAG: hypothetical protein CVV64_15605 [Candidatus Wallbacteria bacterium HGW-Wallbacteria-1]|uniref:MotA/TolQ/ExbB proton channel domain-containing protein n=1 Tax=Candidatus Wallbacteria bacterium HGW-Wallbacteria-1 TaxID=2013854 RepID=A0A2N1PLF9_9BACT|nr:MAG: hypothetical protein CVV64_15605 [Candidatus Wallbacteria bacterium HGW-Wallbacteria-1]
MTVFIVKIISLSLVLKNTNIFAMRRILTQYVRDAVRQSEVGNDIFLTDGNQSSENSVLLVSLTGGLSHYQTLLAAAVEQFSVAPGRIQQAIEMAALSLAKSYRAGMGIVAMVSQTACLMGFMGTVSGMIKTFSAIASTGSANPADLAGGISEALGTTLLGLIIAVPALMSLVFLNWLASIAEHRAEIFANLLLEEFARVGDSGIDRMTAEPSKATELADGVEVHSD